MKVKRTLSEHLLKSPVAIDHNRNSIPQPGKGWITDGEQSFTDVCDLTSLDRLAEDSVVQTIENRFKSGIYYTWAGTPLVAVNPLQDVDELYCKELEEKYKIAGAIQIREMPPHIFAIGQKAYCDLKRGFERTNQSIIVSGESGAGKTWTTRTLMQFIADLAGKSGCNHVSSIEQRILDSNPVLEAFGNASTLRNENSSRFGKYIQLQFSSKGHIVGAKVKTYLLEKTRVVHHASGEKNFHIFYQVSSMSDNLSCTPSKRRRRSSKWGSEDHQAFVETCEAMRNIGIQDEIQRDIFKVLTGIKKMSQVSFEISQESTCHIINNTFIAESVCDLLELDKECFQKSMTTRRILTGSTKEEFLKPCSIDECVARRNSLAKLIYARLFDWIVDTINSSINAPSYSKHSFIGLLDVYGFESFDNNSLEQLCINYANEKLQQFFVSHFLKHQQDEYKKEGIDWDFMDFIDNIQCLNIIEGPVSVFALMNEECRLNRIIDSQIFCDRLSSTLARHKGHFSQHRLKSQKPQFVIHHFATRVCYQVEDLIEKNKDYIAPEVIELLQSSTNYFLNCLFLNQHKDEKVAVNPKLHVPRPTSVTIVSKFKASLDKLMSTLSQTNVHYIRCIRPNDAGTPNMFDRNQILEQLRACGVMETVKICASGYPMRLTHHEFINRYNSSVMHGRQCTNDTLMQLSSSHTYESSSNSRQSTVDRLKREDRRARRRKRSGCNHTASLCLSILSSIGYDIEENKENTTASRICPAFKLGRTKIFLKEDVIEELEKSRTQIQSRCAFTIQCCWRRYGRNVITRQKLAAVTLQKVWRGHLARLRFLTIRNAALVIQRRLRSFRAKARRAPTNDGLQEVSITKHKSSLPTEAKIVPCNLPLYVNTASTVRSSWFMPFVQCGYGLLPQKPTVMDFYIEIRIQRREGIASLRRIEQSPVIFHTKKTPLTNAERPPLALMENNVGLASILLTQ